MRIIGVIDLLAGRAVHARGGRRETYAAVDSVAGETVGGDAIALARTYVEQLGISELYVADLDAIGGATPQDALLAAVAAVGVPLWVDAGVTSVAQAQHTLAVGATRIVVGLETLRSFENLEEICATSSGGRVALSIDLRDGIPIVAPAAAVDAEPPETIAVRGVGAGVGAVIVLDVARVGMRLGVDVSLIAAVRRALPGVMLVAGGGVRGRDDLDRLAAAGCDAALVATALHDGRIGRREVALAASPFPTSDA